MRKARSPLTLCSPTRLFFPCLKRLQITLEDMQVQDPKPHASHTRFDWQLRRSSFRFEPSAKRSFSRVHDAALTLLVSELIWHHHLFRTSRAIASPLLSLTRIYTRLSSLRAESSINLLPTISSNWTTDATASLRATRLVAATANQRPTSISLRDRTFSCSKRSSRILLHLCRSHHSIFA